LKKILLIDDDGDITDMIKIVLDGRYEVETKADHVGIPATMESFEPDLVMLDNSIGQMKAIDIVPNLQSADGYNIVPIVLFSAHADIAGIANEINADAYLAKPFDLVELYTCIDRLIA
jgi:two-component SAPR family response regulator